MAFSQTPPIKFYINTERMTWNSITKKSVTGLDHKNHHFEQKNLEIRVL